MASYTFLPQELVNEVIDSLSDNADLKACSLVSRSCAHPARNQLFHHIRVFPEEAKTWLSRPPESVQRMAPHIVKFELPDRRPSSLVRPSSSCWDDSEGLLTRMISSLLLSPVQWLRIESLGTGGFNETTLEQCFEPIYRSLRSLELNNLAACADATRFLISLFPDLDDLYIGDVLPASMQAAQGWSGCGIRYSPRLSGMFEFLNPNGVEDDSELLASIVSLSPKFHAISPGIITSLNRDVVQRLMEVCAETVESVPFVWSIHSGMNCDLCGNRSRC
jgi:hypothetical protein